VGRLVEEAGDLDVLVANAGLPGSGDLAELEQDQIDRVLAVNLAGPIALTRALLPRFRARGSGHFVFVSSLSGKVASPASSMYSATKFGLRGFALGLRCDLQGSGIGCSVVSPSFVRGDGMFADTGLSLPLGMATVTPKQVTDAVVRAIETNRAEIVVAPLSLRVGAVLGAMVPGISAAVQRRLDRGLSARIAEAQRPKRY
jgi:short-subunit dehydrogenase